MASSARTQRKPTLTPTGSSRSNARYTSSSRRTCSAPFRHSGLTSLLGVAYLTLHLAVTGGVLLWLHRRRPEGFPFVRTALLLASGLALVGFLLYPTATPRLAGVGIVDSDSGGHVDLNRGLVCSLYNPYAALSSMHIGGRRLHVRAIGALYPPFVLLVIVATNHFFLAAGALVAGRAAALAARLTRRPATARR